MQPILIHDFFPNLLLSAGSMTLPNSYDTSKESPCQKGVCTPSSWIHHGVESYVLEDESINGVSSARLWSRNVTILALDLGDSVMINTCVLTSSCRLVGSRKQCKSDQPASTPV